MILCVDKLFFLSNKENKLGIGFLHYIRQPYWIKKIAHAKLRSVLISQDNLLFYLKQKTKVHHHKVADPAETMLRDPCAASLAAIRKAVSAGVCGYVHCVYESWTWLYILI